MSKRHKTIDIPFTVEVEIDNYCERYDITVEELEKHVRTWLHEKIRVSLPARDAVLRLRPDTGAAKRWWNEYELGQMNVDRLREIANGMPYRWESKKEELVAWILKYQPSKVV